MMQISGLPPDLYSLFQFLCISFFLSLGLIYLFNHTDSKNFIHDVNLNDVNGATYDADDNHLRIGDHQITSVARRIRERCGVCGNSSNSRCSRCKSVRYCSRTCQIKHWRAGHKLECDELKPLGKVDSTLTSSSGRRAPGHVGYSEYQQSTKDEALAEAKRSSKKTSGKELQTVEECPICISIIRTSKNSRPSLACDTCKHKFHSTCISKWFSTSKKSKCPLCGSLFRSGGGLPQSSVKLSMEFQS